MPTKHFQKAVFQEKKYVDQDPKEEEDEEESAHATAGILNKKKCKVAPLQSRPATLSKHLTHCEMKAGLLSS